MQRNAVSVPQFFMLLRSVRSENGSATIRRTCFKGLRVTQVSTQETKPARHPSRMRPSHQKREGSTVQHQIARNTLSRALGVVLLGMASSAAFAQAQPQAQTQQPAAQEQVSQEQAAQPAAAQAP